MFEYIHGKLTELTPTYAVIESGTIGYYIQISLFTFTQVKGKTDVTLFIHQVIREDANLLYGFSDKEEREIFRLLISVSGIGANTARLILSSLNPKEVIQAVATENVTALRTIKGIGTKTAQRLIVDLKDKVGKVAVEAEILTPIDNSVVEESLSALVILGFPRATVKKVIDKLITRDPGLRVEEIIKEALKIL